MPTFLATALSCRPTYVHSAGALCRGKSGLFEAERASQSMGSISVPHPCKEEEEGEAKSGERTSPLSPIK